MSSLKATDGFKLKLDLVQKIIYDYTHLTNSGKICISSHVNIQGSERANAAARTALSSSITNMKFPGRERVARNIELLWEQ